MNEIDEQELREFVRLKHHSNGFKNQQVSGHGGNPLIRRRLATKIHPKTRVG